ncbi:MAG: hypothetical protein ACRDYD_10730, partial [Acidimicrobiales bacterium]
FYTQGPVLLAALIGAAALCVAALRPGRWRHRRKGWAAAVLAVSGLALAVGPSLTVGFSYRYQIPLLMLLPPAGAIALDVALVALSARLRRARSHVREGVPA